MGYNTRFEGVLKFTSEPTVAMLAKLNEMLGEDPADHGWVAAREMKCGYIDLEVTKDFSGLKWNGAEKTYYLETSVNIVIEQMRKHFPQFGLTGSLLAQGEDVEDRWRLIIGDDGNAHKVKEPPPGTKIKCPHCRRDFYHEG